MENGQEKLEEKCRICIKHSYRSDDTCKGCEVYEKVQRVIRDNPSCFEKDYIRGYV